MKAILLSMLFLVGCAGPELADDITVKLKTWGAFSPENMAKGELVVTKASVTYRIYDSRDVLQYEFEKPMKEADFNELKEFMEGFYLMEDRYTWKEGQPMVTDVGIGEITLISGAGKKTVTIDPFFELYMPKKLQKVYSKLLSLTEYAVLTTESEARAIAEPWLLNAPTYKPDSSQLRFVSSEEQFPGTQILTYSFTSAHEGYGDNKGEEEVMTPHSIGIVVRGSKVVKATIDGVWDELGQMELLKKAMRFQPMQCQQLPWEDWIKEVRVKASEQPTEGEMIAMYYGEIYKVKISDVQRVETRRVVCQACDICPTTFYYIAETYQAEELADLGWSASDSAEYVSTDPEQCKVIRFMCVNGKEPFQDEIGCGCRDITENICTQESRDVTGCTKELHPVCGWDDETIQCFAYPCAQDYGNPCMACLNEHVRGWTEGDCPSSLSSS